MASCPFHKVKRSDSASVFPERSARFSCPARSTCQHAAFASVHAVLVRVVRVLIVGGLGAEAVLSRVETVLAGALRRCLAQHV